MSLHKFCQRPVGDCSHRPVMGNQQNLPAAGGTVLGMGTYLDPWNGQPFFFLRVSGVDSNAIAAALRDCS
jgi:hypothetical protein